ncbi:MAG TPA: PEPxxWA-CTERM sorting domain-containing protein [Caulobacteraceae bacterium]|nr:PEPxxWA-CTERM sorting domain-containing protein [Caulobacteraceae bacterium]
MKPMQLAVAAVGAASLIALSAPAHATTFADYSATSSAANVKWKKNSGGLSGTLSTIPGGSASVYFSFLTPGLSSAANLPATFTLSATSSSTAFTDVSGDVVQPDLSGTFSFVSTGAFTIGSHHYAAGTDLLSGAFSGAEIVGKGSAGTAKDSVLSGGTIVYSTGVSGLSFGGKEDFSLELTSVTPLFAKSGKVLKSFTADSTGSFSGGVPEPATWSMLIFGFGLAGYALRRQRVALNLA